MSTWRIVGAEAGMGWGPGIVPSRDDSVKRGIRGAVSRGSLAVPALGPHLSWSPLEVRERRRRGLRARPPRARGDLGGDRGAAPSPLRAPASLARPARDDERNPGAPAFRARDAPERDRGAGRRA